jgi:hypothetical protein
VPTIIWPQAEMLAAFSFITMKLTLKNNNICGCGFPLLNEDIPLGTEYEIAPLIEAPGTLKCGGCGKEHRVLGVYVYHRDGTGGGFLPKSIFEEPTEPTVKEKQHDLQNE